MWRCMKALSGSFRCVQVRSRASSARIRQSKPDSGLGWSLFQEKARQPFSDVAFSLGSS